MDDSTSDFRIFTWNCHGKLLERLNKIKEFEESEDWKAADVYVIQECQNVIPECQNPDSKLKSELEKLKFKCVDWDGHPNGKSGVGIFVKTDTFKEKEPGKIKWAEDIKSREPEERKNRYYASCSISNNLNILGIWVNPRTDYPNSNCTKYAECFHKFLNEYGHHLNENYILAGDFNLDLNSDLNDPKDKLSPEKKEGIKNIYKDIYKILEDTGLKSAYHQKSSESYSHEISKTFYQPKVVYEEKIAEECDCGEIKILTISCKHYTKKSHVDYVFCKKEWIDTDNVILGEAKEWLKYSDHIPLIVNLKIPNSILNNSE